MRPTRAVGLLVAVLSVLFLTIDVSAQPGLRTEPTAGPQPEPSTALRIGDYRLEGEVRTGVQFFISDPSHTQSAKFEEYRNVPEGLFLESLHLRLYRSDELYATWLDGAKWGRSDQEFSLGAERLGLWQTQFDWDQTPHVYSRGTARMLATEISPGVFVVPKPRPLLPLYNTGRTIDEVGIRWDTARIGLLLTPTPDWELKAEYTRIHKEGTRAISMSFQTPMNNFAEYLEPIDWTQHELRLGGTYADQKWQVRFGYAFSMFENRRTSVTGDNPCFGLVGALGAGGCTAADGAPGVVGAPGAEERGRVSLAPDNMAHTFSIAGGINLPMRSRVMANASYSLRLQNEPFLAHVITPYIASDPRTFLPDKSLDGMTGVFLFNLKTISRPLTPLTLSLSYRLFDLHDMSNDPTFPASVESDSRIFFDAGAASSPFGHSRQAVRLGFTKQNADVDGRWRFSPMLSTTLGVGWEGWDRSHRNVKHSDEPFAKAAVELTPSDWLLARLTYRPSMRRNEGYNPHPTHIAQDQSPLERKFDEADRDRQQVDFLAQITPTDTFTTALTGSWRADDYLGTHTLGVRESVDWSAGVDFTWTPAERVSFGVGYVHDWLFTKQRQQTTFPDTIPLPSYVWLSDSADTIDTFHASAKVAAIPRKLDVTFGWSYAYAISDTMTRNTNPPPVGGTAGQNQQAKAARYPAIEDELLRIEVGATYHFNKTWSATLGYALETWRKTDFRTDTLNPFNPGVSSIFLGEDLKNYSAHIVGLTLGYRFK
jgi:MtrB/PioB family decaheme-associated outer membrane protein